MSRNKLIALVVLLLAVGGLVAGYVFDPDGRLKGWVGGEPFFAGRSASAWLADFHDPDGNVRAAAAAHLREGGAGAVPVLEVLLKAPGDPEPRWRAADVLGQIGPPARPAGPALIAALADPDPLVPPVAAKALAKLAPDVPGAVPALVKTFPAVESVRAVAAYKQGAAEAVPALRRLLAHPDPMIRRNAARSLGRIGPPSLPAVPDLVALLSDPDEAVRSHAADAVGDLGPPAVAALPALVKAFDDPEFKVRASAVRAVGLMKAAAAAAKADVDKLAADPEPEVKAAAAKARRLLDDTDLTGTRRDGRP
jgi:HEAT repeat protein